MAEQTGAVGAIYYRAAYIQGDGIAFVDSSPDTITDTGNGFVAAGFTDGMDITISGTQNNNDTVAIKDTAGVAVGTITLDAAEELTGEGAGSTFTIQEALPGTLVAGFFNWSFTELGQPLDITDFQDAANGYHKHIALFDHWTATAEGYWLTANRYAWVGSEKTVRFFTTYDDAPNVTSVNFYEGASIVSGITVTTPSTDVIKHTISFEGNGLLALTTRSSAWPS